MSPIALAIRHTLRSGHYISGWTFPITLLLAATVMAPEIDGGVPATAIAAMGVAWVCFAAGLLLIAGLERIARLAPVRGRLVLLGILTLAATRPLVLDAVSSAFGLDHAPPGALPFRVMTNVLVWVVALTATALIAGTTRSLRQTNAQLSAVMAELDASQERVGAYRAQSRAAVGEAAAELRDRVAELRTRPTSHEVSALADQVRSRSHRLAELAEAPPPPTAALSGAPGPSPRNGAGDRARMLRLPPRGVVTILYLACMLPTAARGGSPVGILIAAVLVVVGGALIDRVCRSRRAARRRAGGAGLFVTLSLALGIALSVVAAAFGGALAPALVPALAYGAIALGSAAIAGLLQALRTDQHRLSAAVAADQRGVRLSSTPIRDAVRVAAELLHRDGQGACTVFGLQHPPGDAVAPAAIADLADALEDLSGRVAHVFDDAMPSLDASSIDELVATWGRVMVVTPRITEAARSTLDDDRLVARGAYEVVAEGLLNAVKHGGGGPTSVVVDLISTGAGPRVRVQVHTRRPVDAHIELRAGSHIRSLGARLRRVADGVVLEAAIAPADTVATSSVVSAEHPPEGSASPS